MTSSLPSAPETPARLHLGKPAHRHPQVHPHEHTGAAPAPRASLRFPSLIAMSAVERLALISPVIVTLWVLGIWALGSA